MSAARIIGQLCADLNSVCERVDACNAHLAYLDEITPTRGEQRDEYEQLCRHVQWMHDALCTLDENLVNAYRNLDHLERVPHPIKLASEVHNATRTDTMQATRSGAQTPAIGNAGKGVTA